MTPATIIILTYNSSRFIEDLLKSLRGFANGAEILLVDNASSDDTVKLAKKFGSELKIIETESNLGFAKGNNFGANKATGDYLLFLNSDTSFKNGKLSDMISVFEKYEKAGVVGGKLTGRDGTAEKSAGRFFNLIEIAFKKTSTPFSESNLPRTPITYSPRLLKGEFWLLGDATAPG